MTKAVNLKRESYDVYIGRAGKGKDGYFGNPIARGKKCEYCGEMHNDAGSTLDCYREYFLRRVRTDKWFRERILDLKGKTLGCFCKPNPCHGDIISTWVDMMSNQKEFNDIFNTLNDLVYKFYTFEGCLCGGPLHITLDDGNVRDSDLNFCEKELKKSAPHIQAVGNAIIELLRSLTLEQREIWWKEREL